MNSTFEVIFKANVLYKLFTYLLIIQVYLRQSVVPKVYNKTIAHHWSRAYKGHSRSLETFSVT